MLTTLLISNYALIDHIEIDFDAGLNIITGETGAGKSIVLGALSLLMGERADTRTIRDKERKTIVEARFELVDNTEINKIINDVDIDIYPNGCILRRELSSKGISRAFVNDTPVSLSVLKDISRHLLDIHTQHENLLLTQKSFQMEVLDTMADNSLLLKQYKEDYADYRNALKQYVNLRDNLKRLRAESEYNSYMLEQLDRLRLEPGEQSRLEQERDVAANTAKIHNHIEDALASLSHGDDNASRLLADSIDHIEKLTKHIPQFEHLTERLNSVRIEVDDVVDTLEEYRTTLYTSGLDLEEIERRLGEIYSLEMRHRVSTSDELLAIRDKLRHSIDSAENGDDLLHQYETEAKTAKKRLVETARKLTQARTEAAKNFVTLLLDRALPLGLPNLRCDIRITQVKPLETGMDDVEFLFAFNKNQVLLPVGRTASGGEIARVILAIKSLLSEKMQLPTIIFDEVDTGVSGDIASRMARLMLDISHKSQVISITHIPTVAAHGNTHFKVYKEDSLETTLTHIRRLSDDERSAELAAMISGNPDDAAALQAAHALRSNHITPQN